VKVGDLVKDIHSIVTGVIIYDAERHQVPDIYGEIKKEVHFCVQWLSYAGDAKVITRHSWRAEKDLILLSESP
tara:strand:+ start:604 stop:822 length:219 start_codon:yes stop_codon:yes gene_type:complete